MTELASWRCGRGRRCRTISRRLRGGRGSVFRGGSLGGGGKGCSADIAELVRSLRGCTTLRTRIHIGLNQKGGEWNAVRYARTEHNQIGAKWVSGNTG